MASPKNARKKHDRSATEELLRDAHLHHEIKKATRHMEKLLKRNARSLPRTPGRHSVLADNGKDVVKVQYFPKKQGYAVDSERHQKALAHIVALKKLV